jgi:glycosyltransferase involved in cell wall biosynthesis
MSTSPAKRKIAIVHDWLPLYGGAERVLEQILLVFPQADIFSMIDAIPPEQRGFLQNKPVQTSFVQRLPGGKTRYRSYFPLMPLAVEQFDLSSYDLVISSSYSFAKGVLTGPDQKHLCYCHSPIRYAWDMQHQYLEQSGLTKGVKSWIVRCLLHYIRLWDYRTGGGVDAFAANSAYIARRIMKVYRREAEVIYPPVAVESFSLEEKKEDYYLTASRMVPYKKIDLIAEAFSRIPDKRLLIIGDGPEMARVRAKAGPNVELLGYRDNATLRSHLQKARAFVFMAEEDFGIVPVEAQACGTPVIAFGRGGVAETVIPGETGVLFEEQSAESLAAAVRTFEQGTFTPAVIRQQAEKFSAEVFKRQFADFVRRNSPGWEASLGL